MAPRRLSALDACLRLPRNGVSPGQSAFARPATYQLTADPNGQLEFDKSQIQAPAGTVSVPLDTTDQSQDGVVIDEQPAGGTRAPAGWLVTIYVGVFTG